MTTAVMPRTETTARDDPTSFTPILVGGVPGQRSRVYLAGILGTIATLFHCSLLGRQQRGLFKLQQVFSKTFGEFLKFETQGIGDLIF